MSTSGRRLITITFLFFGGYLIFNLSKGAYDLWQKGEIIKSVQEKRKDEERENRRLKERLSFTQSPEFTEKEARDKLSLIKPGETVVVLPSLQAAPSAQEAFLPNWQKWLKLFF